MDQDGSDIDETIRNRLVAKEMAENAASRGNPLAGMLAALELAASPYYLGVDADPDSTDLDVFP